MHCQGKENKVFSKSNLILQSTPNWNTHTHSVQHLFSVWCSSLVQLSYRDGDRYSFWLFHPPIHWSPLPFQVSQPEAPWCNQRKGSVCVHMQFVLYSQLPGGQWLQVQSWDPCSWYCSVWPCRRCQRSVSFFKLLLKCRLPYSSPPQHTACSLGITIPLTTQNFSKGSTSALERTQACQGNLQVLWPELMGTGPVSVPVCLHPGCPACWGSAAPKQLVQTPGGSGCGAAPLALRDRGRACGQGHWRALQMCCWLPKGPDWCSSYKNSHKEGEGESSGLPKEKHLWAVWLLWFTETHTGGDGHSGPWETPEKAPSSVPTWCHCPGRDCPTRCHLLPHMYSPLSLAPSAAHHCQSLSYAHSHYRYRNRHRYFREKTHDKWCYLYRRDITAFLCSHCIILYSRQTPVLLTDNCAIKFWTNCDKWKIAAGHGDGGIHSIWDHLVLL